MKHFLPVFVLVFASLVSGCQAQQDISQPSTSLPPNQVFFSPKGGCTDAVVKELNAAKETALVQAYSFTSTPTRPISARRQHGRCWNRQSCCVRIGRGRSR